MYLREVSHVVSMWRGSWWHHEEDKGVWVCGCMGERTVDGNAAGGQEGGQERFGVDPPEREASAPDCQLGKFLT